MASKLPSIVIVGRPNVGKSTLFNRLTGTRRSIVTNEPGITRDRIYGTANWEGRSFEVVDTGGIVPEDKAGIPGEILRQASVAIKNAARVVQIVDGRVGPTPLDQELAQLLPAPANRPFSPSIKWTRRNRPWIFPRPSTNWATKFSHLRRARFRRGRAARCHNRGNSQGRAGAGSAAREHRHHRPAQRRKIHVAESTRRRGALYSSRRARHHARCRGHRRRTQRYGVPLPGSAGIRRKGKTKLIAEKLSVIMARQHLERADIALLVADSAQGITSHDATIASYAEQSGRSVIIVMNKWDLALEAAQDLSSEKKKRGGKFVAFNANKLVQDYEPLVRARLKFLSYAPVVFLCQDGENIDRLYNLIDKVVAARNKRISTGELNRWVAKVDLTRGTSPASREVKIFYITQASTAPPTFVLFTNQLKPLHFSYQRFLENELRKEFGFLGTPIRFTQRLKKRGTRHRERKDPRKS